AQEDATPIGTLLEVIACEAAGSLLGLPASARCLGILLPILFPETPAIFVAQVDAVLPAAVGAALAVPVLKDGQMTDGPGHENEPFRTGEEDAYPRIIGHVRTHPIISRGRLFAACLVHRDSKPCAHRLASGLSGVRAPACAGRYTDHRGG